MRGVAPFGNTALSHSRSRILKANKAIYKAVYCVNNIKTALLHVYMQKLYKYTGFTAILTMLLALAGASFIDTFVGKMSLGNRDIDIITTVLIAAWFFLLLFTYLSSVIKKKNNNNNNNSNYDDDNLNTLNTLEATGVYTIIRNPLHTINLFLLYPGLSFLIESYTALFFMIPLFFIFLYLSQIEDRYLEEMLGKYYNEYKKNVGLFIPKIKKDN